MGVNVSISSSSRSVSHRVQGQYHGGQCQYLIGFKVSIMGVNVSISSGLRSVCHRGQG